MSAKLKKIFHLLAAIFGIKNHKSIYLSQNKSYDIPSDEFILTFHLASGLILLQVGLRGPWVPTRALMCSCWLTAASWAQGAAFLVGHLPFRTLQIRQQVRCVFLSIFPLS